MKFNIKGKVGRQEVIEAVVSFLNTLDEMGVEEYQGVNLYLNCYSDDEKVTPLLDGKEFELIHNSRKKHRNTIVSDGQKMHFVNTKMNPDEINFTGKIKIPDTISLLSDRQVKEEEQKREIEYRRHMAALAEKSRIDYEKTMAEERERKLFENKCLEVVLDRYKAKQEDLKTLILSKNWLASRKGIEQYTSEDIGDTAYRISIRPQKDDTTKRVFLFGEEGELKACVDVAR